MSDSINHILENIDRLAFLCLSCTVEERQKYLAEINESVKEMYRTYPAEIKKAVTEAIQKLDN